MATPGLVFAMSSAMETTTSDTAPSITFPDTLAGNCLIVAIQSGTAAVFNATPLSDNKSNTWVQVAQMTGNQLCTVFVATNVAAGTNKITFSYSSADTFVQVEYQEWFNISTSAVASALDGTAVTANVAGASVAAGSITTAAANSLVWQWATCDGGTAVNTSFTKGTNFTLATANTQAGCDSLGATIVTSATQYQVKGTAGSVNPTITLVGGTSPSSDTIAFALKSASAGNAPPTGIYVNRVQKCAFLSKSSLTMQFPHSGNLIAVQSTHDHAITSVVDGDSNTYDHSHSFQALSQLTTALSYAKNVAANTDLKGLKITWSGTLGAAAVGFVTLYDISGADTVNPLVGGGYLSTNSGTQTTNANLTIFSSLTPTNQNDVILIESLITSHTVSSLVAPTGPNGGRGNLFDFPGANGAGTHAEDDDFHGYWYNGTTLTGTAITLGVQNDTGGAGDWTATAAEFTAPTPDTLMAQICL